MEVVYMVILVLTFVALSATTASETENDVQSDPNFWFPRRPWKREFQSNIETQEADLSRLAERAQSYERKVAAEIPNDAQLVPEVQNYDASVPEPFARCCWACVVCFGRRRRSISEEGALLSDDSDPGFKMLGSEIEMKLYETREDVLRLMDTPVIQAELIERPLFRTVSRYAAEALKGKQQGVLVKLSDGRRLLVAKGNQFGRGSQTVAIISNHLTDDWTTSAVKEVKSSTFGDFVKASGKGFDVLTNNGNEAAERMMQLP
jgi:hypothetical protein